MQVQRTEAFTMVDNPYAKTVPDLDERITYSGVRELTYVPSKASPTRNLRDDPLGQMHARGQHPLDDHLYRAGRQYQATREAEGIGRGRSSSDIREFVDGGRGPSDGLTDTRVKAAKQMAVFRTLLGEQGYRVVEAVLIEKQSLKQCARRFYGEASPANVKFVGRIFRECLSTLAREMGLMT